MYLPQEVNNNKSSPMSKIMYLWICTTAKDSHVNFHVFSVWACTPGALLPPSGYRRNCNTTRLSARSVCNRGHKLPYTVCLRTVRVSLSSLSGAVFTSTEVIIPTISGEGTVFSAITCGFSKYRAWWGHTGIMVRRKREGLRIGERSGVWRYKTVRMKGSQKETGVNGKEGILTRRTLCRHNHIRTEKSSTANKSTFCWGCTYNNFWEVFVYLLHKVQKVMNLRRGDYGNGVNPTLNDTQYISGTVITFTNMLLPLIRTSFVKNLLHDWVHL